MISVKNQSAFLAHVRSEGGWAVEEQARDILAGQSLEDQNPNALQIIFDVAERRGEHEMAATIAEYLGIEYEGESDEAAVDRQMSSVPNDADFLRMIDSKLGWAIYQQAKAIMNGEPLEDQNPNALKYISDFALSVGREDVYDQIQSFFEG